jgi:RNA recognition motif-containing protein
LPVRNAPEANASECVRVIMQNRLYVGSLASDVSAGTLQELLKPHGFVTDVKLLAMGRAPETMWVAFVIMATDESGEAAVNALNGSTLQGMEIRVKVPRKQARRSTQGAV